MTCIVGIVHNGEVYLGGDSASISGYDIGQFASPKVFRIGDFVLGYTSSFRMGQLLQYYFNPPPMVDKEYGGDTTEYIVTQVIPHIRELFKEHGYTRIDNNQESGGIFLLGFNGHLYTITSDFHANERQDNIDACGCGRNYALGAMKVNLGVDMPVTARLREGLEAAEYFSAGVVGPFTFVGTDL